MKTWNPTTEEIVDALRRARPLSTMAPARLRSLAPTVSARSMDAGETLRPNGNHPVLVVVSGSLRVRSITDQGDVAILRLVRRGETHGVANALRRDHGGVHVEASAPTRMLVVPGAFVHETVRQRRGPCPDLLHHVADELLAVERRLMDTLLLSKSELVVRTIVRLVDDATPVEGTPPSTLWTTHQELAWLAGCTRETATVVLATLRAQGVVATRPGSIEILDHDRLRRWRG